MEKWEIRPPLPQKSPNRSSPKFAWVITSGTPTCMQNFITIRLPPSPPPQICENAHQVTPLVFFGSSFGLQTRPRMHRFLRSICQMTRFRAKMCLLGVPKRKFYISTPFPPKRKFFANFRRDFTKISRQKGLNNGDAPL